MKYIAAYMLAKLGGKENPKVEDIKEIIESIGIEYEEEKAEEICFKLNHKNINDIINDGKSKLTEITQEQNQTQRAQQTQQHQTMNEIENNEEEENENENESLPLGIVFDDLFN